MLDKVKTKGSRRLVARVAVTGALLAIPMAALAGPALADTLPGVVQADQNWQHNNNGNNNNWQHNNNDHRNDRDHRGDNNHWNQPAPPPPWFNGGPGVPQLPSGLFGSS